MECPVCYECSPRPFRLTCDHCMCYDCAHKWYIKSGETASCPMCREEIHIKSWEDEKLETYYNDLYTTIEQFIFDTFVPEAAIIFLKFAQERIDFLKEHSIILDEPADILHIDMDEEDLEEVTEYKITKNLPPKNNSHVKLKKMKHPTSKDPHGPLQPPLWLLLLTSGYITV